MFNALPNTLDPLEYITEDVIVCTTIVCAVNVFLTVKLSAEDAVAAFRAYDADKAYDALAAFKTYDAVDAVPKSEPVYPPNDVELPVIIRLPDIMALPVYGKGDTYPLRYDAVDEYDELIAFKV